MAFQLPYRFILFTAVGVSGILVNMTILWLGTEWLGMPYALASLLAIQIAIFNNFIWNKQYTWKDRPLKGLSSVFTALGKFILVSWIAGSINWILLIALTELAGWHYMIANLGAILIASIINYLLNDFWTFRLKEKTDSEEPGN